VIENCLELWRRETGSRDDRFDLHARMKPRRETTDPGRVANVSRNPRPSRSTPQPPFAAHTNHSTLPYVKTDITNRKCIF
jgi:hypothetical protein